jgi:hypothetical protein
MKIRFLLLFLGLTICGFGCAPKSWQPVSENGFTVSMPGAPTKGQQSTPTAVGDITAYTYSVEFRNEAFTVAYNDYPASAVERMTDTEKLLDGGRTGAISNLNGTLTEEHPVKLAGYTGREFTADSTEKGATVTDRIFWVPPRLYQVIYTRRKGEPLTADGKKFLDSFSLQ